MRPIQKLHDLRRARTTSFGLASVFLLVSLAFAGTAGAATQVPLGSSSPFAVLGGTTVTNTGPTIINGDMGISPGTACTGFRAPCTGGGPGVVNGDIHSANATSGAAQTDLTAAYNDAAGQPVDATIPTELGGSTIFPGVYDSAAGDFGITGTLTLDAQGNPNAVFIFKTASTLVTAAGNSNVNLVNGAQSCNVFWQVGSSATLGTNTVFRGNILALTAIGATTGAVIDGRLLARNAAVTMDTNTVTRSFCAGEPTLTITNVPRRCVARNFVVTVRVSGPNSIRHTDVFLDGKRVKRSSKARFKVKIPARKQKPGGHKLRAVATDQAGRTRVRGASYRICSRAAIRFTG